VERLKMNQDNGIKLIARCLEDGGDEMSGYDSQSRPTHVTIWDGSTAELHHEYKLNLNSVIVLAHGSHSDTNDVWDGDAIEYSIFKFDKGLGIARNSSWWGPTFGECKYDLEIQESHDWDNFFNFVLTDEFRRKFLKIEEQLNADLTEIILLNKECDIHK
jgi:hypothetical protein